MLTDGRTRGFARLLWPVLLLAIGVAAPHAVPARDPVASAVGAAIATGSDLLETEIAAERLEPPRRAGDGPRFVTATRLSAGDEVHYTIRVRNPGEQPVRDVRITKRVPLGMHYIAGSAAGPASSVEFSVDGGETFHARPDASDGYTHLRWTLRRPLPPGATALLRFRATFR